MDSSDDDVEIWENEEMQTNSFLCFMCNDYFNDIELMFNHILKIHNVDLKIILKSANVDDEYDWIKLVNFLRKNISSLDCNDIINNSWKSDEYLKPEILDDNLLFIDYETVIDFNIEHNGTNKNNLEIVELKNQIVTYKKEKNEYKLEITELKNQLSAYQSKVSILGNKVMELMDGIDDSKAESTCTISNSKLNAEDQAYFTGYSHYSIHDIMIKDTIRTESYRKFIEENGSKYFQNKIVLDVGCGTGILSMFAARSGAAHVYSVDCADIIYDAMAIVDKNGLKDKITLIHGKLEEIKLPCDKVDVVISEWMGYSLIYESMLDSVLYACRRYLDPVSGLVFPRYFTLSVVGAEMGEFRKKNIDCWNSVSGFDMSSMGANVMKEVLVDTVVPEDVVTEPAVLRQYDVQLMAFDTDAGNCPQTIDQDFRLVITKSGIIGAIVIYFDTYFLLPGVDDNCKEQVSFSTGPSAASTHWQQSILLLDEPIIVVKGDIVNGRIFVTRHKQGRRGLSFAVAVGDHKQKYEFS